MENLRCRAGASAGSGGASRRTISLVLSSMSIFRMSLPPPLPDESVTVAEALGVTVDDLLPAAGQESVP